MARPRLPDHQLTEREQQVRACLYRGLSNAEIAAAMAITEKTVESHIRNIYEKESEPLLRQGPARRIEYLLRWIGKM